MTRTTAREIAIQLGFAASAAGVSPQIMFDRFFDKEYYQSLAGEDELYSEYPSDAQLEYIRRLTVLCDEKREERDGYIQQYSKGWQHQFCAAQFAKYFTWTISPILPPSTKR